VVMIYWFRRPRVNLIHHPLTRARALMARPWSARCYGVARQREGSRQTSIGCPALTLIVTLTRTGALMARPWSARCYGVARQREGSRQTSIGGPRVNLNCHPYAHGGADGQAVVCPLLRGSSATRGVAPNQHRGPPRPALTLIVTLTRTGALMARPWSARCYGVARQREGSRQTSIGPVLPSVGRKTS